MCVDVFNRGGEVIDDFDGEDVVEVFRVPVLFGCGFHRDDGARAFAAEQARAALLVFFAEDWKKSGCNRLMDEQRLHGVADGDVLAFRVDGNVAGHVDVRTLVDEHMADAVRMAEDGDV